jgi:ATP-dependent RNA helicase DDX46/PRP5
VDVEIMGHFDEEIEINDFPQQVRLQLSFYADVQARWRVTRRETIEEITQATGTMFHWGHSRLGAAITVRGTYFPPDKRPDGDRKLYVYIEGPTQSSVLKTKAEIEAILREELQKQATTWQTPEQRRQIQGTARYKVLSLTN